MPSSPALVLVDPRTQRRAALLRRAASIAVGCTVAALSAIPFVLSLGR
ncbi:hypothetical protein [Amnibacterium setariae]|nr:hypothetical protein [Amnibacterium setariae]